MSVPTQEELFERISNLTPAKRELLEQRLRQEPDPHPLDRWIPRRPQGGDVPLSFAQQRLWILDQLEPGTHIYNDQYAVRMKGALRLDILSRALQEIVRRHEALRTSFAPVRGELVQIIAPELTVPIPVQDLRHIAEESQREAEAKRLAIEEAQRPFSLAKGPVIRTALLQVADEDHVLVLTLHHIVSDAWALGVLIREIAALYTAYANDEPSPLPELKIQYGDFAYWQQQMMKGNRLQQQLLYWKKQLSGTLPVLEAATDFPRPPKMNRDGATHLFQFSADLTERLEAFAKEQGVTLYMTLLTAFKLLLAHHARQTDIIIGAPMANRTREEVEGLIGCFFNTLALRTDLSGALTFRELLGRVSQTVLEANAHQDVPFEKILEEVQPERHDAYTPIFQVMFTYHNTPLKVIDLPGVQLDGYPLDLGTAKFDLLMNMTIGESGLVGWLDYRTDLYRASTAEQLVKQVETLLEMIVSRADVTLEELKATIPAMEKREPAVEKKKKESPFKKKSSATKPKAVGIASDQFVKTAPMPGTDDLLLLVEPAVAGLNLTEWASLHREWIETKLTQHGGLLFRGFLKPSMDAFEQFTKTFSDELAEYKERSTPRTEVHARVYTSTEYPAAQHIPLHNENSYAHAWPKQIWFHCMQAAQEGGETPIGDSRRVYDMLSESTRQKFAEKGVLYVRNYSADLDLPWQTVFQTEDPAEVEAYCRSVGMEFEWLPGGRLRTRAVRKAIAKHPVTGDLLWFNQAHLFHVSSLGEEAQAALLSTLSEADLPRNTYYGDGTPIEPEVLAEIRGVYDQLSRSFPWQEGDIMMLDNMRVTHGRTPFAGSRKVVVAMAGVTSEYGI